MKIKSEILIASFAFSVLFGSNGLYSQSIRFGWIDRKDVHVSEDSIFVDTGAGAAALSVQEYDCETNRFLVECIQFNGVYFPTPDDFLDAK